MPSIELQHKHSLTVPVAKQKVEAIAVQLKNRLGVDYHWEGDTMKFARPGAHGSIVVQEHEVIVSIELGMMLSPFKGEVQKQLQGYLDQELG